ncbi:MAG: pseudouridine synthase [Lawsonella clevelandensis]
MASPTKTYVAIAPLPHPTRSPRALPLLDGQAVEIRSRIVVSRNRLDCYEEPGEPNAHTTVELVDSRGDHGLYRLTPHTGKTHQLRVHMNSLGTNLVGRSVVPSSGRRRPRPPGGPTAHPAAPLAAQLSYPPSAQTRPPDQADAVSPRPPCTTLTTSVSTAAHAPYSGRPPPHHTTATSHL